MTVFYVARNNVATTTTGYTAGAGSIALAGGAGASFGTPSPSAPIVVSTFLADGTAKGIYSCTGRTGDTLTGLTLLSGTDATLPSGGLVEMRWTAEAVAQITDALSQAEQDVTDLVAGVTALGDPAAALAAHVAASDPHPQYLTSTDGDAVYAALAHDHDDLYYTESEIDTFLAGKLGNNSLLSALGGMDATAGLVEQLGGDNFGKRAIGVGASTSIPTRADADGRYAALSHTHAIADTTGLQAALDAKAALASPTFTGTPIVPTAAPGTNTGQAASTAFVGAAVAALVASAPGTLDTLNELASALGSDPNFATTVTNALAAKAPLASPTFTGTPSAPTATAGTNTAQIATTAFVGTAAATKVSGSGGPAAALDPSTVAWVAWIRAHDIAGADNASVTSFSSSDANARTFTGTGTLKTGANGINNRKVLRFNGSSNVYTTPSGGASLAGAWYMAAVIKFTSVAGYQSAISFGDAATGGRRRLMYKDLTNTLSFNSGGTDLASPTSLAVATPYFVEFVYDGTTLFIYVGGYLVASQARTLTAYTATALILGNTPSLGAVEYFFGDLAEAFFLGSVPSDATRAGLARYVSDTYGVGLAPDVRYGLFSSSGTLGNGTLSEAGGYLVGPKSVINGINPVLTGGTSLTFTNLAACTVYGSFAAAAGTSEHYFRNSWTSQNVAAFQNVDPNGYSAIRFLRYTGQEMAAVGYANVGFPWGGPNGSTYMETSNFFDTTKWGDYRETQVKVGTNVTLRRRIRDDTRAHEFYDLTAAEPAVNGPTTGLVLLFGKPATAVAANGTLNTNITTGATQCGLVVVKDATNSKCAVYRLENATLTAISADAEFSTTLDNASTVNVYNVSGQLVIQNKTAGSLNLTAAYYGA